MISAKLKKNCAYKYLWIIQIGDGHSCDDFEHERTRFAWLVLRMPVTVALDGLRRVLLPQEFITPEQKRKEPNIKQASELYNDIQSARSLLWFLRRFSIFSVLLLSSKCQSCLHLSLFLSLVFSFLLSVSLGRDSKNLRSFSGSCSRYMHISCNPSPTLCSSHNCLHYLFYI